MAQSTQTQTAPQQVGKDFLPINGTDYDEFIFYYDGNFFSRDNIRPGMVTLHPRGIHHGPHPKALKAQATKTHTDEYAVMLDGLNPLHILAAGDAAEWKEYWTSWSEKFFERIAQQRVHVVSVVPTLLQFLLHENSDISRYDLSHFRHVICGAGPLTVELALKFEERYSIPIIHGYGLSETTCYSCFLPLDLTPTEHRRWLSEYGFPPIGVPIPQNEMAIHDEHGNELPEGVKGEIVIRGHNVMKEYYSNPDANAKTFAHGWFRSGDEGFYRMDSKRRKFFFITGRLKELIIRGGANISPFEIDEVLMNIPGVKAGLAVGFENDWYGEEVGAYVQLADGCTLSENDIIQHCRKVFSFQKSPKVVFFGNDIPVTSTGKYQRNKLKPLFAQWKSVQFTERKRTGEQSAIENPKSEIKR